MFGKKRKAVPVEAAPVTAVPPQAPVVVIVETSGRRRRPSGHAGDDEKGHPVLKTLVGMAIAKRMVKRRKRPLRAKMAKSLRKGKRKAAKAVRKARRNLR